MPESKIYLLWKGLKASDADIDKKWKKDFNRFYSDIHTEWAEWSSINRNVEPGVIRVDASKPFQLHNVRFVDKSKEDTAIGLYEKPPKKPRYVRKPPRPIIATDKDGNETEYPSPNAFAEAFGVSKQRVLNTISDGRRIKVYKLRYKDDIKADKPETPDITSEVKSSEVKEDKVDTPKEEPEYEKPLHTQKYKPLILTDTDGNETEYPSALAVAEKFGTTASALNKCVKEGYKYRGRYTVRYRDEDKHTPDTQTALTEQSVASQGILCGNVRAVEIEPNGKIIIHYK